MRVAIMQPYFFPYIGYYQLIAAADIFIVYDNIKYTKKGWINRNRILRSGSDVVFSLPLKNDSDTLDIQQRELAVDFNPKKLLNQLRGAYQQAPFFDETYQLAEQIILNEDTNLFNYLHNSLVKTCSYLEIATQIQRSSVFDIDQDLKGQEKVLALCGALKTDLYINAAGGRDLYSTTAFSDRGFKLNFIQSKSFEYPQFGAPFVPWLSILDVLFFCKKHEVISAIRQGYNLLES